MYKNFAIRQGMCYMGVTAAGMGFYPAELDVISQGEPILPACSIAPWDDIYLILVVVHFLFHPGHRPSLVSVP